MSSLADLSWTRQPLLKSLSAGRGVPAAVPVGSITPQAALVMQLGSRASYGLGLLT